MNLIDGLVMSIRNNRVAIDPLTPEYKDKVESMSRLGNSEWQVVMMYALLQELKELNYNLQSDSSFEEDSVQLDLEPIND